MLALAGASQAQPGAPGAQPPAAGAPAARPTIAVFNMAAVMRDYGKAKYQVYQLNDKRTKMSGDLVKWRGEYVKLQAEAQQTPDPKLKDEKGKQMLELARKIEDKDREVNKALNDDASTIISSLYDDIKTVVDKTAEMNGYHIVFAYPDAVTDKEMNDPMVKELKLKPPAAQPFFVAPQVDITGVVVGTLNKWYPAPAVPDVPPPAPGTTGAPGTAPAPGAPPGVPPAPGVPPGK
jgi:Skp family chaperone for outer membrane proteins